LMLQAEQERRIAEGQRADIEHRTQQTARQTRLDDVADADRRQVQNQRGVQRMIGDFLIQRGSQPLDAGARNQVTGMAVSEGIDVPRQLTEAPSGETFTLSPGSKRFDATGNVIASVPANPAAGASPEIEESRRIANELKALELERKRGALEQENAWREKTGEDAKRVTQNAYDLATRLKTHPGLSKSHGAYEMRGFTQDAQDYRGIRAQLVAALALPNLGALKGPMSDKDIVFVKNLATRLENDNLSDGEAQRAIGEAITFLESKGAVAAQPSSGGGGGRQYYDANGKPVKR
jgi:hypothetical protein